MSEITLLATWPAQDNADRYRVRLLDAQGAPLDLQDVATTSAAFGPLDELTTYQLELVAYHAADESDPQLLSVTTPEGEEGASSLLASWEDPTSGDTARLLDDQGAEIQDLGAVTAPITLTGLATDVSYQLELTRSGGAAEVIAFTTPSGPPGVTNIQHTFTTTSLTFTWEGTSDPDQYLLTLSRDGTEVATQTVTTLTATFTTLEDGTQYDLAIQAENAQGTGPIAYYQATTGYIAPASPTNLRQFEERIIAVICRWDLAEPDKVFDVEVQMLYGDELILADALDGAVTERTIIVPMASTDYLLRVRAGNPGGWSAWAEATVHSEKFPLIDSRLGVMGATYQEDVLHTDTWDGASDQLKGVVEAIRAEPAVLVGSYSLAQTYRPPREVESQDLAGLSALITIEASERLMLKETTSLDSAGLSAAISVSATERAISITRNVGDITGLSSAMSITTAEAVKQFRQPTRSTTGMTANISILASEVTP